MAGRGPGGGSGTPSTTVLVPGRGPGGGSGTPSKTLLIVGRGPGGGSGTPSIMVLVVGRGPGGGNGTPSKMLLVVGRGPGGGSGTPSAIRTEPERECGRPAGLTATTARNRIRLADSARLGITRPFFMRTLLDGKVPRSLRNRVLW